MGYSSETLRIWSSFAAAIAVTVAGCAANPNSPASAASSSTPGVGVLSLALTGALPDVDALRLRVYRDSPSSPVFDSSCVPYTAQEVLTVNPLETGSGYSMRLELFKGGTCTTLRFLAFRGAISVAAQTSGQSQQHPYYVQPLEVGQFTGLPLVAASEDIAKQAQAKSCNSDAECKGVHKNATCSKGGTCVIDTLFPLNGAVRRGFPSVLSLADGTVAVTGGLSSETAGIWKATVDWVEVFDPTLGLFSVVQPTTPVNEVGLGSAAALAAGQFVQAGGANGAQVGLTAGTSLTTTLDASGCVGGGGAGCAVSPQVAAIDIHNQSAAVATLTSSLVFPAVVRVKGANGERLLIAGGAKLPIQAADTRTGQGTLCTISGGSASCTEQPATMQTGRARAAVACLASTGGLCQKVMLLGGRKSPGTPLIEIYDAAKDVWLAASVSGVLDNTALVHGGDLVHLGSGDWLLVGASKKALFLEDQVSSSGADLGALLIKVDLTNAIPTVLISPAEVGAVNAADLQRLLSTAVALADGSALVIGGLDAGLQVRGDAVWFDSTGKGKALVALDKPRFGAGAALLTGTAPLAGAVVLAGGFAVDGGVLAPQNHVEIFLPGP